MLDFKADGFLREILKLALYEGVLHAPNPNVDAKNITELNRLSQTVALLLKDKCPATAACLRKLSDELQAGTSYRDIKSRLEQFRAIIYLTQ